ncbi:MAG: M10 family metallopeptidase C-terminal domain-containing protein [Exiguobacterium profundum]|nr:MAG: M10 family metallopeptidase C-terminal domain-containing protein [Exiguobacterium profundum]
MNGGAGRDVLIGGDGADDFVYSLASDSGATGATRDQINGFVSGQDDIVLRNMDADVTDPALDAFIWRGTAGFSGVAGQLRWSATAAGVVVQADLDGDRDADFSLLLAGINSVLRADFLL